MRRRLLALLILLLVPAGAGAAECTYESLAAEPSVEAARVRPVVDSLRVRERGPGSKAIGALKRDQWVSVKGRCGDWLEVGYGYGEGWIFGPLTCQSEPPMEFDTPRQRVRDFVDPPPSVWHVSTWCPTYSISGNHLRGRTDEEIAAEGKRKLGR